MRTLNLKFAAALATILVLGATGVHLLHLFQSGRIAQSVLWQARKCRDAGQDDQFIRYAYEYLSFRPDDPEVLTEVAELLRQSRGFARQRAALGLYERVLRARPEADDARRQAVDLCMGLWLWAEAAQHIETLRGRGGEDADLLAKLGDCQKAIGKYDEAATCFRKAMQTAPNHVPAYLSYAAMLQGELKKPDEAITLLERAAQANPDSAAAHVALARFLRSQRRLAEAEKQATRALALAPDDAEVLLTAAEIDQLNGRIGAARERLQKANGLFPSNVAITCALSWLLLYEGKPDVAIAKLREGLDKNPRDVEILTLLGDTYAQEGQIGPLEDVIAELERLKAKADRRDYQDRVSYLRARLLMRRSDWKRAAAALDQLRTTSLKMPVLNRQANHLLARCCEQLHDPKGELDAYRRILSADPNSAVIRLEVAQALMRAGQTDEAVKEFRSVLGRSDVLPRLVVETTQKLLTQTRFEPSGKSRKELERVLESAKVDECLTAALARLQWDIERGQGDEALALTDRHLRGHPQDVPLLLARVRLLQARYGTERALAALTEADKAVGDNADLRIARIRLLAPRVQPSQSESLVALERGVERFGADQRARILTEVAAAYRLLGDAANARRVLERIRADRPDDLAVRESLFADAVRSNEPQRCRELAGEVAAIEGGDGFAGKLLEAERLILTAGPDAARAAPARKLLDEALVQRPNHPVAEFLLGRLEEVGGRPEAASPHYRTALANGLLDLPVDDLFASLAAGKVSCPAFLAEPTLSARLQPDRQMNVVRALLALARSSAPNWPERLTSEGDSADAAQWVVLGKLLDGTGYRPQAEKAFRRAMGLAPGSEDVWLDLVAHHSARNEGEQIQAVFAEARKTLPDGDAQLILARCSEAVQQPAEARREYAEAIKQRPNDTRPRRFLAEHYLRANQLNEVRQALQELAGVTEPSSPQDVQWARRTLAQHLTLTPSFDAFQRAVQLLDANRRENPSNPDDQRALALVLASQRGRSLPGPNGATARQQAIQTLEALQKQGQLYAAENLVLLAKLYRAENDAAKLAELHDRLRHDFGDHPGVVTYLAGEAVRAESMAEAAELIATLRKLAPGRFEPAALEFQRLCLNGEHLKARTLLEEYVAAAPPASRPARARQAADLIHDFLQSYPQADRPEAASTLRDVAIRLYGRDAVRDPDALARLLTLMCRNGQTTRAFDLLLEAQKAMPPEKLAAAYLVVVRSGNGTRENTNTVGNFIIEAAQSNASSVTLQLCLADYYDAVGMHPDAITIYRGVLANEPDNVVALNNLAWILAHDKRAINESLSLVERAIDKYGPVDELLDTRARVLLESGQPEKALRDLSEAIAESPSATRYFYLAVTHQRRNNPELAQQALRQARKFGISPHDLHPLDSGAARELLNR